MSVVLYNTAHELIQRLISYITLQGVENCYGRASTEPVLNLPLHFKKPSHLLITTVLFIE